ncbi:hypothetical protein K458DRAFT_163578 [Lentithecium fluviatile CBS 122367]|uniref:Zn(2)-C6 fungal-type domain-containing protein n=1 Tax=Lentithecium fluviatile CBS 122367 TaxID=1168545 RepID=A0A6G1IGE0_9PLEO|nr:hypothetical protein K458DRAFT_163578 [Lentithecium fluviatile CBS 122367]
MLPTPTSPSSSGGSVRTNCTKPVRLRTACNQCCGAKVKCSGEKTGCQRCRNLRMQCVYQESRVGKVPGIRAKKRRLENEQQEGRVQMAAPPASVIASNSTDTSSLTGDDDDALAQWAQDAIMNIPEHNADFLQNHDSIMASMGDSYNLPAMDFNLDTLLQPFPASPPTQPTESRPMQSPISQPQTSSFTPHRPRDRSDSQFVIDCTQIVSDLENYIVADLKSFKIVLGLVKRALEKVVQLSDTPQAARNMRCTILLTAIMYQVVELLDVCYIMLSEDSDRQCNPSFTLRPANSLLLPGLGLGDFGIDAEEQNAWRSQMILKEVRQAGEVLRKMKMLATKGPEQLQPSHGRSRGECFVDLELKLTDLAGRIARRR